MINSGNPSVANLQMRKYVKEHKQSSSQIFEKLNRRGRLNPAQNECPTYKRTTATLLC
jgi:competence protein ComGC